MHLGAVVDLVCVCDNILYSTILSGAAASCMPMLVVVPRRSLLATHLDRCIEVISNVLAPLPMEVLRALRNLSKHWVPWIELVR